MKKIYIIILLILLNSIYLLGQINIDFPNYGPPSPHAQSLMKYGDFPVSYYTGVADIQIPIHTIKLKDISLPINLCYNSSGIKVNEEASRVGLGWNLVAGGLITHTIMGRYNDFDDWYYFSADANHKFDDITDIYKFDKYTIGRLASSFPFIHPTMHKYTILNSLYGDTSDCGVIDLCPDLFTYNFLGYSGNFIFSHDGTIIKEKNDNIIITPIISENINGKKSLDSFTLTTPDGTKYYFNQTEKASQSGKPSTAKSIYNSSYYLTKIESINGSKIDLFYKKKERRAIGIYGRTQVGDSHMVNMSKSLYDVVYIDKIDFPGGTVRFEYLSDRQDFQPEVRLKTIYIDKNGINTSKWNLIQDYFLANSLIGTDYPTLDMINNVITTSSHFNDNWNKKRLKLNGIEHIDAVGDKKYSYNFKYNETNLPTKLSTSIDHWGYFNGAKNINQVVPSWWQDISFKVGVCQPEISGGNANRDPSSIYNQAFILKEITYPTGGKSKFTYEGNYYLTDNFENDPSKRDFMYGKISTKLSGKQSQGLNNIPNMVGYFTIGGQLSHEFTVSLNFILDKQLYGGDPYMKLSIKKDLSSSYNYWNHTYNSLNLPIPSSLTADKTVTGYFNNIKLMPGTYIIMAEGNLFKHLKSIDIDAGVIVNPDEYLQQYPVGQGGGLRIKEITSYDIDEKQISKDKYIYSIDGSSDEKKSSGKLMFYPRYRIEFNKYRLDGLRGNGYSVGYSNVYVDKYDKAEKHIGRMGYEFINIPDKNLNYSWQDIDDPLQYSKDENPQGVGAYKYSENGTILKKIFYRRDLNGYHKVKEIQYEYSFWGGGPHIIWGILKSNRASTWSSACLKDLNIDILIKEDVTTKSDIASGYLYPALRPMYIYLDKEKEILYESNGVLETVSEYKYNSNHQISKEILKSNIDEIKTIEYKYPFDYPADAIMNKLTTANRISFPMETKQTVGDKISLMVNDYAIFNNIPQPAIINVNTGINKTLEPRIQYHNYDKYGNPNYITKDNADKVVYLWSYNGQYPIAELKNVTYGELTAIINEATLDAILSKDEPTSSDWTLINSLQTNPAMGKAHITIYKYKPLVGITEMTNPQGLTTYYEYDSFGRLKVIYMLNNNKKEIIESYEYNYKNQ